MEIFPAIDLREEKVVRLTQGDFNRETIYSNDPVGVVDRFESLGARNLHIVDLDGARNGSLVNFESIKKLAKSNLFIEVGGGIRDEDCIKRYLDIGVNRVILGTIAVRDFKFTSEMIMKYKEAIAVGIDARNGIVALDGWGELSDVNYIDLAVKLSEAGLFALIFTDISKDGTLSGTNIEAYKALIDNVSCNIIASGGISTLEEINKLNEMKIHGAILGKALYSGTLDLKEVICIAD